MKKSDAVIHFGGVKKLADALGLNRTAVYHWGEEVPWIRQVQIEQLTQGALKAGPVPEIESSTRRHGLPRRRPITTSDCPPAK